MEQPTGEITMKSKFPDKDQNPKAPNSTDLKLVDHGPKRAEDASSVIALSDENTTHVEIETKGDQAPSQTSFASRKSVHWNSELVSESPAPDQKVLSLSSSPGSKPYVARTPAENSDVSLKDTVDDGNCQRCAWEMGKEGWRNTVSRLINFLGLAILLFGVTVIFSVALGRYNRWRNLI